MAENETPVTTPDHDDTKSMERLIVETLAESGLPPSDLDLESAEEVLTEEDLAALDALGSPQVQVARIIARSPVSSQAAKSTLAMMRHQADTETAAQPQRSQPTANQTELQQQMKVNAAPGSLSWTCDYRIKKKIGSGGQGTVHLLESVEEPDLPKALKIFSPAPYKDLGSYYQDMDRMKQVASELYKMQVDNLVSIEKTQYRNDVFEMIMRWIDGHDLAALLQPRLLAEVRSSLTEARWQHLTDVVLTEPDKGPVCLKPGIAANIIEKCLRALDAMHSHGIVHGDIKPSNIMLDQYGSIRLVDIGSAFDIAAPPRQHTWTPLYAPPEIFQGNEWTPQSDLASLGYVLIELLTGRPAVAAPAIGSRSIRFCRTSWDRTLMEEKKQLPSRLGKLLPANVQESEQLMEICRRLIDPDPRQRFSSAEEALEGPTGTHQFQQALARMSLSVPYSQEIKRWLTDVMMVL